jgi:hypothetical protein
MTTKTQKNKTNIPGGQHDEKIATLKRRFNKPASLNYQSVAHLSPAEQESTTTVFQLVEEILKHV